MKKRVFGLVLLLTMLLGSTFTAHAEATIPPSGELSAWCGADGNIDMYVHVSEEVSESIVRLVFLSKNTGDEYFYKFNPVNYDDETIWVERINIPKGEYFVSCRVTDDYYGSYRCSLFPKGNLVVGDMLESIICLVGPEEWIDSTYAEMEKAEAEAAKATATPEPTLAPETEEDTQSGAIAEKTDDELDEIKPILEEEPVENDGEKNLVPLYVILGIVAVVAVVLVVKFKKK